MDPFAGDKILRFPERIAEWMRSGKTCAPIVVDFDLTNRCPHNCPACPGEWRNDPSAQWEPGEAIAVLRQFAEIGAKAVSFGGGGDPLAHPQALEIIEAAVGFGLSVGVITNGAILHRGWPERLAECCSWIRVSLDAADAGTFARAHGVPERHFFTVLDNISRLARVPEKKVVVGVGVLTDEGMRHEIGPAASLVKATDADYVQFRPFNYDRADVSAEIRAARARYEQNGFRVLASWPKYELMANPGWKKPYRVCHIHHFATVINAKGDLHFCCDLRERRGWIGNVREGGVADVWADLWRMRLAQQLDLTLCPPFCRGNAANILLDRIAQPMTHEDFL